jgi:hypothetical protein
MTSGSVIGKCPYFFIPDGFQDAFCFFGIVPETGLVGQLFFFLDLLFPDINVKGTSSRLPAFFQVP